MQKKKKITSWVKLWIAPQIHYYKYIIVQKLKESVYLLPWPCCFCRSLITTSFSSSSPSPPPLIPAAIPGGEGSRDDQTLKEEPRAGLRRALHRVPLLSLPPDCGFRGLRLGLDHCTQTLQSQLLFRPVRVHVHAEIPAHSPGAARQPQRLGGALLYPNKDVSH